MSMSYTMSFTLFCALPGLAFGVNYRVSVKAAVIIPSYNEAENIEPLATQLLALENHLTLIIVDDNSPDGTGRIAFPLRSE
jgi:cellulose synthase/poly-beta-1,6-N-acetylglucosamine synthase-like glycosyltransferase